MSKKIAVDQSTELAMKQMGALITEIRGERSLRKVAEPSGIPASQLQYIERGSMAPTAEVFTASNQQTIGRSHSARRDLPPPQRHRAIRPGALRLDHCENTVTFLQKLFKFDQYFTKIPHFSEPEPFSSRKAITKCHTQ